MEEIESDNKKENASALICTLNKLGCCSRCILKFISTEISEALTDSYLQPEEKLRAIQNLGHDQPEIKRVRRNPCSNCLGILEDSSIEQFVSNLSLEEINYYECKEFVTMVSLPKCVLLRTYSLYFYLRKNFADIIENPHSGNDYTLKRIFRIASSEFIYKKINKIYKPGAKLHIEFEIFYEDDEQELETLKNKRSLRNVSRGNIEDFLKGCTEDEFREVFPVPPPPPLKSTTCRIKLSSEPLYLGGRYLKFSREMGQTPFLVNDKYITEYSVEDIVFKSIKKVLNFRNNMVFSGSGREDSDTRMLGDGRPFYIQIEDPSYYDISFQQCREIEADILKSKLCAVIKLQPVENNIIKRIKEGEQHKRKHYRALCHCTHPNVEDAIKVLNIYKDQVLEISQKTPIRVLHRRTIIARMRLIYSMQASLVPGFPQLIQLDLITQAGTYVKEFVNSDFSRTDPSVTKLLGYPTDVVALDVMKVELEWP